MALVALPGAGIWVPSLLGGPLDYVNTVNTSDTLLMDATIEEVQLIGSVTVEGGGSKTFGTAGSSIGWLPGGTATFAAGSTLAVGVKDASKLSTTTGPPARATAGQAAFNVYKNLVGGTDTITATTWRADAMASGTPFTVTDGDLLCIAFLLTVSSGTPVVSVRGMTTVASWGFPLSVLITSSGGTFAQQSVAGNAILTFDDGTLGWLEATVPVSATGIYAFGGSGRRGGNLLQFGFPCQVDAIAASFTTFSNAGDFSLDLYSAPLTSPVLIEGVAHDANMVASTADRLHIRRLTTKRTLAANTPYCVAVRQTAATSPNMNYLTVNSTAHLRARPDGGGDTCYAVTSLSGAAFTALNTARSRFQVAVRICALDDGAGGALRTSRPPKREALRFARRRG